MPTRSSSEVSPSSKSKRKSPSKVSAPAVKPERRKKKQRKVEEEEPEEEVVVSQGTEDNEDENEAEVESESSDEGEEQGSSDDDEEEGAASSDERPASSRPGASRGRGARGRGGRSTRGSRQQRPASRATLTGRSRISLARTDVAQRLEAANVAREASEFSDDLRELRAHIGSSHELVVNKLDAVCQYVRDSTVKTEFENKKWKKRFQRVLQGILVDHKHPERNLQLVIDAVAEQMQQDLHYYGLSAADFCAQPLVHHELMVYSRDWRAHIPHDARKAFDARFGSSLSVDERLKAIQEHLDTENKMAEFAASFIKTREVTPSDLRYVSLALKMHAKGQTLRECSNRKQVAAGVAAFSDRKIDFDTLEDAVFRS